MGSYGDRPRTRPPVFKLRIHRRFGTQPLAVRHDPRAKHPQALRPSRRV